MQKQTQIKFHLQKFIKDIKTSKVVRDVIKVLDKVWLIDWFVTDIVSTFSAIDNLKFSLILSKTTIVSFNE